MATSTPEGYRRTVVIGMDGNQQSEQAFDWYIENIYRPSDIVIIVLCEEQKNVVPGCIPEGTEVDELYATEGRRVSKLTEAYTEKLKDNVFTGKVWSERGIPGEVILNVAIKQKARFIVLGSKDQRSLKRKEVGSVADYVTHHSLIPVLVYRPKQRYQKRK